MTSLYPEIVPYNSFQLKVDELHELYVEESGNPQGLPVVFLHGGPGAGCEPHHRRFFDSAIYRIILFDQRGCGRSTPHAELSKNTTWYLVEDMEAIRSHLSVESWLVFGGSWGSTLALAYAERYPQTVLGLILRGIFLARDQDVKWFYQQGASRLFPDYWQDFIQPIAEDQRGDLVKAYYQQLTSDDETTRLTAAQAWSRWEGMTATLSPDQKLINHFGDSHNALSIARIECHYFINNSFFSANQLLANADKLRDIPGYIIHGRYDSICPLEQAWSLSEVWSKAQLQIIEAAGHAVVEPGITQALVQATDEFARELSQ